MSEIARSLFDIRLLEKYADRQTVWHRVHPLLKLCVTFFYIVCVLSVSQYNIGETIIYAAFPALIAVIAEVPYTMIFTRCVPVLVIVSLACVWNIFLDTEIIAYVNDVGVSSGAVTFINAVIRAVLTVSVALLFTATTKINDFIKTLEMIKVPDSAVVVFVILYRYLFLFFYEADKMTGAYRLRAGSNKAVAMKNMGNFAGSFLLKTVSRGNEMYNAMLLRGFHGGMSPDYMRRIRVGETAVCAVICVCFVLGVAFDISGMIGGLVV